MRGYYLNLILPLAMSLPSWAESDCNKYLGSSPPLILQTKDYTCGPACVLSLLNHNSVFEHNEELLLELLGTTEEHGTTVEQMTRGLEQLGFSVTVKAKHTLADLIVGLANSKTYFLLVQSGEDAHWVLTNSIENGRIVVMDPSPEDGNYQYFLPQDFQKLWSTELSGRIYNHFAIEVSFPKQQGFFRKNPVVFK